MPSLKKDSFWLVCLTLAFSLILQAHGQVTRTLPAVTSSVVVVVGATLIDGTGAPPVPGTTLVIKDGRILQIGRRGEVPIPAGAQVIQADGKTIIPGLIDAHVHYNAPFLHRLYLAHGVTTVRDVGTSLERILTLREEIARGNILAPRLFATGPAINPRSVKAMGLSSAREMTLKLAQAGVDGIKVTGYNEEELKADLVAGADHNPVLGGPDQYYDPSAFTAPPSRTLGNVGRNTLIAPGVANLDLSLTKNTAVGEYVNLQFRAEFFNIFNRANFGLPEQSITSSRAGRIDATTLTNRQIQFGLRIEF